MLKMEDTLYELDISVSVLMADFSANRLYYFAVGLSGQLEAQFQILY